MKPKITHFKEDGKFSGGIKVEIGEKQFVVPVIDVRDGENARTTVKRMIKAGNRSKFMQPTYSGSGLSYQSKHI